MTMMTYVVAVAMLLGMAVEGAQAEEKKTDHPKKEECCPQFEPKPWNEKEITWENKPFVKDRVRSFLHIPLNFGRVMMRNCRVIEEAEAGEKNMIVLSDENSLWGADVYISVRKEVPGANMARISGTFLSKVFEGPYRDMGKWVKEINAFVEGKGKKAKKLYFYYTTCPKCAKESGKNYVVILAEV